LALWGIDSFDKRLQFIEVKNMETACDIITVCCVLQNCCLLSKDSGEDCIDDVENQELDVYNDQPLNATFYQMLLC
jgi:hypothetical protein